MKEGHETIRHFCCVARAQKRVYIRLVATDRAAPNGYNDCTHLHTEDWVYVKKQEQLDRDRHRQTRWTDATMSSGDVAVVLDSKELRVIADWQSTQHHDGKLKQWRCDYGDKKHMY
eukprot:scaffold194688_cov50-Attheya_sp.AAC.1